MQILTQSILYFIGKGTRPLSVCALYMLDVTGTVIHADLTVLITFFYSDCMHMMVCYLYYEFPKIVFKISQYITLRTVSQYIES